MLPPAALGEDLGVVVAVTRRAECSLSSAPYEEELGGERLPLCLEILLFWSGPEAGICLTVRLLIILVFELQALPFRFDMGELRKTIFLPGMM